MPTPGYYRFPTLCRDTVVFVSEDDLWTVPSEGGVARRLTANLGTISFPTFSPDGAQIAFTGREEGNAEVYLMPAEGGPVRRVTYLGVNSNVLGWTPDGSKILFSSDTRQPFRAGAVYAVRPEGGEPEPWPVGLAVSIDVRRDGLTVLGRNNVDPARWKRYRGGTAGDLWIDAEGSGQFRRLIQLKGNLARPMWIGDRVFFLSDHQGIANLYSCLPSGEDLRRHTHRKDYFVRFPASDGARIVYHAGADLFLYDPRTGSDRRIEVAYHSPRVQRQRKFVDAAKYLESYAPHPEGHSLALTARGKSFTMGNWEGAVTPQVSPKAEPLRYRLTRWLNDGKRVVTITDAGGLERLEIHHLREEEPPQRLEDLDIGRPYALRVSPTEDHLILANHRNELVFVDLAARTMQVLERNEFRAINGLDWSPDGRWVAYGYAVSQYTTAIKLWDRSTGDKHVLTEPILNDVDPAFDPEGKYLYFMRWSELNPVYDNLNFDLGFPKGVRPYLITLRADLPSPFLPSPHPLHDTPKAEKEKAEAEKEEGAEEEEEAEETPPAEPPPAAVTIDLEGIANRVVAFPVPEARYDQIAGIKGKVLFTSYPVEGALEQEFLRSGEPPAKGTLDVYDFKELKQETLLTGITDFQIARDGKTMVYRTGNKLRVVKAGEKVHEKTPPAPPSRKNGWVDLGRVKVSVDPGVEWRQMAHEAWRLQREYFWTPDMSRVDWAAVWERYAPLIERVGTRGEFSDLMWEMQGELGTSHAYEFGGDYRQEPSYPMGFLGADFAYDSQSGGYKITHIVHGTPGNPRENSPLEGPGVNLRAGDVLLAINGQKLSKEVLPQELLVHQAGSEVVLTVAGADGKPREVTVQALKTEVTARYREWVEQNRQTVHQATNGRVGYVHIPDMGARGYAEFHRTYLAEVGRDALIVDVRFNGGGHVSQLLIEKLARKRVGYDVSRWGQPEPYPSFSVAGPMVALTNQFAGSDGDIFSHVFKLMKLGPLIGKRTWGGVIGIGPRNLLADGSMTTQPEYSFWFQDVGWGVENYGTDPDIDIDIAPQDYARGYDPQMEKAISVILELLEKNPPAKPSFEDRPNLAPPDLPDY
ncbi:MAG TPA: S41 family peptidase [Chthonomonadaceae bacterium]|nr:S41 family peptidase [Chthonomonadaceae bacterium]